MEGALIAYLMPTKTKKDHRLFAWLLDDIFLMVLFILNLWRIRFNSIRSKFHNELIISLINPVVPATGFF